MIARLVADAGPPTIPVPTGRPTSPRWSARSPTSSWRPAAARAIHGRLVAALDGDVTAERVLATPAETLRAAGLSGRKVESLRDLATKVLDGTVMLDPRRLARQSDEEITARLSAVKGIGKWSADIFLMFRLRRLDVWPTGDLGVRKGYALAWQVPMPTEKQLVPLGEPYRPYRSVVAWYCWRAVQLYGRAALTRPESAAQGALIAGFMRSCYRHWIPWRVHPGGAGGCGAADLPAAPVASGPQEAPMSEPESPQGERGATRAEPARDEAGSVRGAGHERAREPQGEPGGSRWCPESVARLAALGLGTVVQEGAGAAAWFPDAEYAAAGATVRARPGRVRAGRRHGLPPPARAARPLRAGQLLLGLLQPLLDPALARRLAEAKVTAVSLDGLPRTLSRAQSMDALTSQANVAGYKAALLAADLTAATSRC